MSEIGSKMDLIKLDMVVKDIHHLWSEVPSPYIYPKSVLAESRSMLRTNVRRSLVLAQKAHKLFQKESSIATRYNLVRERIAAAGESARHQDNVYVRALADGDYGAAETALDLIVRYASTANVVASRIRVELVSTDENGSTIIFANDGENVVTVRTLDVTCGSVRVRTDPSNTFVIPAGGSRKVIARSATPLHVQATYADRGETRSIETEL